MLFTFFNTFNKNFNRLVWLELGAELPADSGEKSNLRKTLKRAEKKGMTPSPAPEPFELPNVEPDDPEERRRVLKERARKEREKLEEEMEKRKKAEKEAEKERKKREKEQAREASEEEKKTAVWLGPMSQGGRTLPEKFPHNERLPQILQRMGDIVDAEFGDVTPENTDNKKLQKFLPVLLDIKNKLPEFLLYKASVEKWSEANLYQVLGDKMRDLYRRSTSNSWGSEIASWWKSKWHDWLGDKNLKAPDKRINPEKQKITGVKTNALRAKLLDAQRQFQKKKEQFACVNVPNLKPWGRDEDTCDQYCIAWDTGDNECGEWIDDDELDFDMVDFLEEEALPFYREYSTYKGFAENQSPRNAQNEYFDRMTFLYHQAAPGDHGCDVEDLLKKIEGK